MQWCSKTSRAIITSCACPLIWIDLIQSHSTFDYDSAPMNPRPLPVPFTTWLFPIFPMSALYPFLSIFQHIGAPRRVRIRVCYYGRWGIRYNHLALYAKLPRPRRLSIKGGGTRPMNFIGDAVVIEEIKLHQSFGICKIGRQMPPSLISSRFCLASRKPVLLPRLWSRGVVSRELQANSQSLRRPRSS